MINFKKDGKALLPVPICSDDKLIGKIFNLGEVLARIKDFNINVSGACIPTSICFEVISQKEAKTQRAKILKLF